MKDFVLEKGKLETIENLQTIQVLLGRCVSLGMIDEGSHYYNELVDLISNTEFITSWDALLEIITHGKTVEGDMDAWLSLRGESTLSLVWPSKEKEL